MSDFVDFVFASGWPDERFEIEIVKELKKRGYSSFVVVMAYDRGNKIKMKIGMNNFIDLFEEAKKIQLEKPLEYYVNHLQEKFGIENIRKLYLPERDFWDIEDEKFWLKKTIKYLLVFEQLLNKGFKAKYFVQYLGAPLHQLVYEAAAKAFGATHIWYGGYGFLDRISFTTLPKTFWSLNKNIQLEDLDLDNIANYIENEKKKRTLRIIGRIEDYIPKTKLNYLKKGLKRLSFDMDEMLLLRKSALRYLRRLYRYHLAKKYYTKPFDNEKFFYFPLHLPHESTMVAGCEHLQSQEFLIEILERNLPYGYKLYVKGHPAAQGWYPISMFKRISKLKNIRILNPKLSSYDLISKAAVVCTIFSSVGFEALMYQKPVITFGRPWYSGQGVTLDVNDFYELPIIMQKAISFKPDWNQILKVFATAYKSSYPPGVIECLKDKKSIPVFVDSLIKHVRNFKTQTSNILN